ncbi:ABC transporter ATP-binding protein [Paenibacillus lycopersici]|uniref:ABC transporter ATP-binding protein n=2 Tax=Paenibacillus lycopersici TaxID=2704462 RepID=A0A6C0G8C4_9BACL|nr:ABC transporter ATP-binding protein [Paenibacillus lycopersici]
MPIELWLVKSLVDRIRQWHSPDSITPILLEAAWLGALMVLNNIVLGVPIPMAMTRLMEIGAHEEQRLLMRRHASLPLAVIETPAAQDLYDRAAKISFYDIYNTGTQLLQSCLQAAVLIAMMLFFGQWLPVFLLVAAGLLLVRVSGKSAESIEQTDRSQTSGRRLLGHYAALMTGRESAKELRLFGLQPLLAARWTQLHKQQARQSLQAARGSELRKLGPELLMALLGGILIAMLVLLPNASHLSAGDFTLLFMAFTMLLSQLPGWIAQGMNMRTQFMRWEEYNAYMRLDGVQKASSEPFMHHETPDFPETPEAPETPATPRASEAPGSPEAIEAPAIDAADRHIHGLDLRVHQVSFAYPGSEKQAVQDVSFVIPSGCRAALVGHNGSGKSTLVKLLTGLYAPDAGEILWRQADGASLNHGERNRLMSAVFQDFTKLAITLRENVAIGALPELNNDGKLAAALQAVGAGYRDLDAQLGAAFGGIEPSGGEWQRIVTARALLRDAKFVFFDEPTAALDPAAERQAFDLFLHVTKGRSALLVTHRLGAARLADRILVMKDGRLVEEGTHEELMQRQGEYSRMFALQASWYQ